MISRSEAERLFELQEAQNEFETLIERFYSKIVKHGDTVVDGGAHYGMHTIPLAKLVGPTGVVLAFEPVPNICDHLRHLTAELRQVKVFQAALGEESATRPFYEIPDAPWMSSVVDRGLNLKGRFIEVIHQRLDQFTHWPISFMKLGLEGGDYHALLAGRKLLGTHHPLIVFECGRVDSAKPYGYTREDFFRLFEECGYKLFDLFGRPFTRETFMVSWDSRDIPHYIVAEPPNVGGLSEALRDGVMASLGPSSRLDERRHITVPSAAPALTLSPRTITLETEPLVEFGEPVKMPFKGKDVQAYRDKNSGYIFFEPPTADELYEFYQSEYAERQSDTYYNCKSDYDPAKNAYQADRILSRFEEVNGYPPKNALELGCAFGGLVAEMKRRGVDTVGFDVGADAIKQGRNAMQNDHIFHASNLDALDQIKRPFDLIYSLGSLEHDPAMVEVIAKCSTALSNRGVIYVVVPNAMFINSIIGGFRNNFWAAYPEHLHMPSPGFLLQLCDATGFEPLYWNTDIVFYKGQQIPGLYDGLTLPAAGSRWQFALEKGSHGMALNFSLTPKRSILAKAEAVRIERTRLSLEANRLRELETRNYLRTAER
jgi:FkbM family methyltransferase